MSETNNGAVALREARAAEGMTQAEVGLMLACTADRISKIERGAHPSSMFKRLAEAFLEIPTKAWDETFALASKPIATDNC